MMALSVFKRRQELLIHGYVKENYKKAPVPHALLSLIAKRHNKEDPKLIIKQISSYHGQIHLEVYLDKNPNRLLNIAEYECEYECEEQEYLVTAANYNNHKKKIFSSISGLDYGLDHRGYDKIHCFNHLLLNNVQYAS